MAGVLTILFTDLVGSTELMQRLGDDVMEVTRREHFAVLRSSVAAHGGQEVKSVGDGLMAAFPSTMEAVSCAIRIQQEIDRRNRSHPDPLEVRIGMHVGEPIIEGDDYYGTTVVVAKRLCDESRGGQILTSQLLRGLVGSRAGFRFRDLDSLELKGLDEPVAVAEVVWEPERRATLPLPGALLLRDLTPFVGREAELASLGAALKRAGEGRPQLATLGGEPGIGKTRLAAEFVAEQHDAGSTVLFGRCDEQTLAPYQPFVEALSTWAAASGPDVVHALAPGQAAELARLVPAFGESPGGDDSDRYRLFEAVAGVLSEISRTGSVIFVLDDVHWADQPSLLLLRHLLRTETPSPILYLATYRETELARTHPLARTLSDLRREVGVERVSLRGLTPDQVMDLLSAAAGHDVGRRGRELANALWQATEGNPFFIESIIRHLVDSGRIFLREGVWTYETDVQHLGIPEGVKEVIGQRLSRLGSYANQVLRAAAVLGRDFNFEVLAKVTQHPDDQVLRAIDDAIAAQLVAEEPGESMATYSFTHALIRQTLYEELHLARKQRMHLKAAEAIEEVHSRQLEPHLAALAIHYRMAGAAADPDKAIVYSVQAAARAVSLFGYEESVSHSEAALELMEESGFDPTQATRLRERIGDLLFLAGIDYERSESYLTQALAEYEEAGEQYRAAQVHSKLGRNLSTFPARMDISRAMDHFESARPIIESTGSGSLVHLKLALANAFLWGMRNRDGAEAAAEALELAQAAENPAVISLAAALLGWFRFNMGELDEGIALMEHAWHEADGVNRTFSAFSAAWVRASAGQMRTDPDDMEAWAERELSKPRIAEAPFLKQQLMLTLVWSAFFKGDLASLRSVEADIDLPRRLIALLEGDLRLARDLWAADAERVRDSGNFQFLAGNLFSEGQAARWLGDTERAESLFREGLKLIDEGDGIVLACLTRSVLAVELLRQGRVGEAQDQVDQARRAMPRPEDWRGNGTSLHLAEALMTTARAGAHDAEALFLRAIETSERYRLLPYKAEILYLWGQALVQADDRRAGAERLDAAAHVYRSVGMGDFWLEMVEAARPR